MGQNSKIINNTNNRILTAMNNIVMTTEYAQSYDLNQFISPDFAQPLWFAKPLTPVVAKKIDDVRYLVFEFNFYMLDNVGDAGTLAALQALMTLLTVNYKDYIILDNIYTAGTYVQLLNKGYLLQGIKLSFDLLAISDPSTDIECCNIISIEGNDGAPGADGPPGEQGPQGIPGDPASNIVTSVNTQVGNVVLDTDDISEGTHKYYTDALARAAFSVSGSLGYNSITGVFSFTESDPIFVASAAHGIGSIDITNWNLAYNKYVSSIGFNTSTGVLTLTKNDATTLTQNLDGRYIQANQNITVSGAVQGSGTTSISTTQTTSFGITLDGLSGIISTGSKGFIVIPYNATIQKWYIQSDISGSIVIDIKRSGSSIVGGGNTPTLSSASSANATVSGWTSTTITAYDTIEFSVTSSSTLTRVNLSIIIQRTT